MALTETQRREKIDFLVQNCDCWRDDRETVSRFTDDKLVRLVDHELNAQKAIKVANAAAGGLKAGNLAFRVNPETGEWEQKTLKANGPGRRPTRNGDDEEEEKEFPPEEEGAEEEEEAYMAEAERDRINKKRMAMNRRAEGGGGGFRRPRTTDEWLRAAPEEAQLILANAQQIEQREKDKIISQLLSNVPEGQRAAHHERLQQRTLNELVNDLALVPKPPTREELERAAGGRPTANRRRAAAADDDMLEMPKIAWDRVNNAETADDDEAPARRATRNTAVEADDEDDGGDEWMKHAPPSVRQAVQNALAIEQREKRKIVDELVENVHDEEKEAKLRSRLMARSLEELQEMSVLKPQQAPPARPNYFGSSAPLANQGLRTANPDEDVLPPPRMDWTNAG